MKTYTQVRNLQSNIGKTVTLGGWVSTVRRQKTMQFLVLRDGTGYVQITHERAKDPELGLLIDSLTPESVIEVTGRVTGNPQVKLSGIEVVPERIAVQSIAETPLPIQPNSELDKRLDWRFLDLRDPKKRLILEIQTTAEQAMREFWIQRGLVEIHSPKLMATPSESKSELFQVNYFGGNAYLAQSPQFYKQMGIAAGLPGVFEIGPVFRANPSFTTRHDTEFTSIDAEIAWVKSHYDVMAFEEQWISYVFKRIAELHGESIVRQYNVGVVIPRLPFPVVTMAEAEEIVRAKGHRLSDKGDLDPKGERLLSKHVLDTEGHQFVFVVDYPVSVRPFYHMRHTDRSDLTKSFDLLFNGVEVTTGAQREHRYDVLVQQALEKRLSLEPIQFYLNFFRYGCPPHGGYGFGLTRMLMMLLGLSNVREVTYVYRGPNRLTP